MYIYLVSINYTENAIDFVNLDCRRLPKLSLFLLKKREEDKHWWAIDLQREKSLSNAEHISQEDYVVFIYSIWWSAVDDLFPNCGEKHWLTVNGIYCCETPWAYILHFEKQRTPLLWTKSSYNWNCEYITRFATQLWLIRIHDVLDFPLPYFLCDSSNRCVHT